MGGVVLETLSNKQLIAFTLMLLAAQIVFLVIGGTIAPAPTSAMVHSAHFCIDKFSEDDRWFLPWTCEKVAAVADANVKNASQIVFSVQFPHRGLEMSRWHQFIVGTMSLEIHKNEDSEITTVIGEHPIVTMDFRLGAKDAASSSWTLLGKAREQREHKCQLTEDYYDCDDLAVFELGSCHYDTYLLNIRLPGGKFNQEIGMVNDINFVEIHQNGGFTRMWFALKTIIAPLIIATLIWFKRRTNQLHRSLYLFEKALFTLGVVTAILDFPLEWLTLWFDMPYMLLVNDLRQGLFHAVLLTFWLIFAGEHVMDQTQRNSLKVYRKEVVAVLVGALSLLIFDLCERGVQLQNPFHSIWMNKSGAKAAMGFIIFAGICACLYFLFFLVMMVRVFWHISGKRAQYSRISVARRVAYEGAIYRFKFLLAFTILCAALTIAFFIASNVNEAHWKFGEKRTVEISSALFAGIYGLWNIYVFAVLSLYAPSQQTLHAPNIIEVDEQEDGLTVANDSQRFISQNVNMETSVIYSIAGKGNFE